MSLRLSPSHRSLPGEYLGNGLASVENSAARPRRARGSRFVAIPTAVAPYLSIPDEASDHSDAVDSDDEMKIRSGPLIYAR